MAQTQAQAQDALRGPDTHFKIANGDQQTAALRAVKPWYRADPGPRLKPSVIDFYRDYVKLEGSALMDHLYAIQSQAWPLGEYPCVGQWLWLWPTIQTFKSYPVVLDRLRHGEAVLDLGCCFGQDLRRLAADGAPTANMYASDLHAEFWQLGYDLYRDRERMKARFIQADILDGDSRLRELRGKIDIFIVCKFLHLFSWDDQIAICKRIVDMSRPGATVFGYQIGHTEFLSQKTDWGTMCFQTAETFKDMWAQVSKETDTSWEIEVEQLHTSQWGVDPDDYSWMGPNAASLNFTITRI